MILHRKCKHKIYAVKWYIFEKFTPVRKIFTDQKNLHWSEKFTPIRKIYTVQKNLHRSEKFTQAAPAAFVRIMGNALDVY